MSEPKLISPLLDGFAMGSPMSDHDGVRCCPAIKENSDKKYIVKIISVPASQVQMDALLLAGAYKDPADAMDYFKEVADGVVKEAEILQKLSKLEGFLPYEGWQVVPITRRRLGYQVYLTGTYKKSLDKYVRRNPVTHLEAVNLGLDLCSALSVSRQAGYLYVDLKPTNVFMTEDKGYRIGDLGFIERSSLKYMSLPDKYRSPYSPPELHDPMATLNETADTYAVGMILYQLYNDGHLPFKDKAPGEALPSPVNADYEIAEIIMKAIHPDPAQRWTDPKEMGQALVAYMQRNTINDTPITLHIPLDPVTTDTVKFTIPAQQEETPAEETAEEPAPEEAPTETEAQPGEPAPQENAEAAPDETEPAPEDAEELLPHEMSEEMTRIVEQADDLIAHQLPQETVMAPEPEDPFAFAMEEEIVDDLPAPTEEDMSDAEEEKRRVKEAKKKEQRKKLKKAISTVAALLVVAVIACGAAWAYQNYYLQTIDSLTITGDQYALVVSVDTKADTSLLTVTCSDSYGGSETKKLVNGEAVFTDLLPDSLYKIQLETSGFHKLVGQTSDIFTTDSTTKIVSFTAVTGAEDGSVLLNFTVSGGEPEEWVMKYTADGEEDKSQTFTGHSLTISGLTIGKKYTFTLEPNAEASLSGVTTLEFMATRLILAENLVVTSSGGSDMTVRWNAPGDIVVDSWDVRCYSESGYEQQLTVTDTEVSFSDIDPTVPYTVEVTAAGMTQPARTSITANPINITALNVDESDLEQLTIRWDYSGAAPEGGWLLMYSIDGSSIPNVIKCSDASAVIAPRIPSAKYEFTIQAADSTSIFGNVHSYICPSADVFESNGLSAEDISAHLIVTPDDEDWTFESVGKDAFTDHVTVGDKISVVLQGTANFYVPNEELSILYVIRDNFGNVLPDYVSQAAGDWKDLWYAGDYHYGELDVPIAPDAAGNYSLSIYFNGLAITVLNFTVME